MATKKKKRVLKSKRAWMESQDCSNSFYELSVASGSGYVGLTLADCSRRIEWQFGCPGDKRAVKKITTVKKLIDSIYDHLTAEAK